MGKRASSSKDASASGYKRSRLDLVIKEKQYQKMTEVIRDGCKRSIDFELAYETYARLKDRSSAPGKTIDYDDPDELLAAAIRSGKIDAWCRTQTDDIIKSVTEASSVTKIDESISVAVKVYESPHDCLCEIMSDLATGAEIYKEKALALVAFVPTDVGLLDIFGLVEGSLDTVQRLVLAIIEPHVSSNTRVLPQADAYALLRSDTHNADDVEAVMEASRSPKHVYEFFVGRSITLDFLSCLHVLADTHRPLTDKELETVETGLNEWTPWDAVKNIGPLPFCVKYAMTLEGGETKAAVLKEYDDLIRAIAADCFPSNHDRVNVLMDSARSAGEALRLPSSDWYPVYWPAAPDPLVGKYRIGSSALDVRQQHNTKLKVVLLNGSPVACIYDDTFYCKHGQPAASSPAARPDDDCELGTAFLEAACAIDHAVLRQCLHLALSAKNPPRLSVPWDVDAPRPVDLATPEGVLDHAHRANLLELAASLCSATPGTLAHVLLARALAARLLGATPTSQYLFDRTRDSEHPAVASLFKNVALARTMGLDAQALKAVVQKCLRLLSWGSSKKSKKMAWLDNPGKDALVVFGNSKKVNLSANLEVRVREDLTVDAGSLARFQQVEHYATFCSATSTSSLAAFVSRKGYKIKTRELIGVLNTGVSFGTGSMTRVLVEMLAHVFLDMHQTFTAGVAASALVDGATAAAVDMPVVLNDIASSTYVA